MARGWEQNYRAARTTAGFYPVSGRALTALTGDDRNSFLHGMVVSEVNQAPENSWTLSACLTPKGKMLSDLALYHLPDKIWIETEQTLRETVETTLRRYALRAAIELEDLSGRWSILDITGPDAGAFAGELPEPGQVVQRMLGDKATFLARTDRPLQPTLRWLVPATLEAAASDSLLAGGATRLDPEPAAALRMEAGIPVFGTDVSADNLVLEVPAYRPGISFEKGCYIGQETVARLHARGEKVARYLRGVLTDPVPDPGSAVMAGGKQVGTVTSTTWSPAAGRHLSLAILHRSAMEHGAVVEILGTEGTIQGTVTELPLQDG